MFFAKKTNTKGISLMQINYTGFRPNIKGVNIKKSYILDNTYHIEAVKNEKALISNVSKYRFKLEFLF